MPQIVLFLFRTLTDFGEWKALYGSEALLPPIGFGKAWIGGKTGGNTLSCLTQGLLGQCGNTADWLFISRVLALSADQSKAAQVNLKKGEI